MRLTTSPCPPHGNFGGGDLAGNHSPEGTRVVFHAREAGRRPTPDRNQSGALFVENADAPGWTAPTNGLANSHDDGLAHWSPDGTQILFADPQESLSVVHPDGSGLREIPLHAGGGRSFVRTPGWAPDSSRVVSSLVLRSTGEGNIYTARPDGTNLARITDTPDLQRFRRLRPVRPGPVTFETKIRANPERDEGMPGVAADGLKLASADPHE